jgi:hypothetical protein
VVLEVLQPEKPRPKTKCRSVLHSTAWLPIIHLRASLADAKGPGLW